MCHPSCNNLYSSHQIWIIIDSQILDALFCVTGLGLASWRIQDLYLWCRQGAGTRRKWFGSSGSNSRKCRYEVH
ncbi:LOW QUALITY PROTEIN: hypothetical protein IFM46972_11045 [Aspergillus udagawae]|uniref:Uncharacterized protein n=1 Tax=Aspergillus udagawae TaxID=91492 RepID=A0A8H3SFN9_9EURO|nr:LOW QUALITY PROTEIN: hypothetical protein IFM46972_11045 [Aspergillus udagawae]